MAWLGPVALCGAELGDPVALEAGGEKINTEVGHAAPWVADIDGDGLRDLLLGCGDSPEAVRWREVSEKMGEIQSKRGKLKGAAETVGRVWLFPRT